MHPGIAMSKLVTGICLLVLLVPAAASGADRPEPGSVLTLWPLVDWRSSPQTDYTALHLLGPIGKWETKGEEREIALRPLFFFATSAKSSQGDILFPLVRTRSGSGYSSLNSINLLEDEDRTPDAGGGHTFTLFPFLFYDRSDRGGTSFAVFPLGGRILHRFQRDEIRFALFPLYGQTRKGTTTVTNLLWPFFAFIDGEQEAGFKAWPLFGASSKSGVYRKRFFLWPLVFDYDLDLDTDQPRHIRTFWPFYGSDSSPRRTSRVVLWPFFSFRDDREKGYKKWDFPWPIWGITRGEHRYGNRFLPLYAHDVDSEREKLWLFWPLYRFDRLDSPGLQRRRHSVLFFLYRDQREWSADEEGERLHRVTFWPLFRYQRYRGVAQFSLLALVEPIFPESEGVERNWAPLWRIYQGKWDRHGNRVDSLLWNLFWLERRPEGLAMELFPLFSLRESGKESGEFALLKGLFRYQRDGRKRNIKLFYLPWGFSWRADEAAGTNRG